MAVQSSQRRPLQVPLRLINLSRLIHLAPHMEQRIMFSMPADTSSFALGLLQMSGSYPLTDRSIDEQIMRTSPGNYALGYLEGDTFSVFYVGRSDSDLRAKLHTWVGAASEFDRHAFAGKASWGQ